MSKIAIYARVSDMKLKEDGQRRQDVMRQVDMLLEYANRQKEKEPEFKDAQIEVFKDDGVSAFKEDYNSRPEFIRLMREIKGNHVQRVWVESLDRWARRVVDGLTTLREASEHSCTISSLGDGVVDITTSQGWFKAGISLMFAEWASRDKSERVISGMARRLDKKENLCEACGIVHMGRHPSKCLCSKCLLKRVGQKKTTGSDVAEIFRRGLP